MEKKDVTVKLKPISLTQDFIQDFVKDEKKGKREDEE